MHMHMAAEREAMEATFGVSEAEAFLDKQKIACLLCKRQFTTVDVLLKYVFICINCFRLHLNDSFYEFAFSLRHAKMSELHKQNLTEVLGVQHFEPTGSGQSSAPTTVYRDRAKERRLKFGSEAATPSSTLKVSCQNH